MTRAIVLSVLALFALSGHLCRAQSDDTPSPWVVAPRREGPLTAKDRRARDAFLKLIDGSQDEEYRKEFEIVVPDRPTGLGDDYDVLLYGRYLNWYGTRIEIVVRGDKVTGEMVSKEGIFRGELTAREFDVLVRQLAYAYQSEERERTRPDDESIWIFSHSFATHTPEQGIVVVSRSSSDPFHLRTDPKQLIASRISTSYRGVRGFAETGLARAFEKLARDQFRALDRDHQASEVLVRLKKIDPVPVRAKYGDELLTLDDYSRDDLAAVEAMLYSHLAVELRLKDALPELRRLKLTEPLELLTIATADDPTPLLEDAIINKQRHFRWALEFAVNPPKPVQIQMLVRVMPQLKSAFYVEEILQRLEKLELTSEQQSAIIGLFADSKDLHTRVVTADFLLKKYGDDRYYDFLHKLAADSRPQEEYELGDPVRHALSSVLAYSVESGRRRGDSAALARTWLAQIPATWQADGPPLRSLLECLGRLGTREDLPLLEKFCEHEDSSLIVEAVEAVAGIDIHAGLRHVRTRIERFVADQGGSTSFRWDVWPYFGFILMRSDTAAIAPLEKALAKLESGNASRPTPITDPNKLNLGMYQGAPPGSDWMGETRLLLAYLRADTIENRVAAALAFARDRKIEPTVLREVARQLSANGADPEKCRPLLDQAEQAEKRSGTSR